MQGLYTKRRSQSTVEITAASRIGEVYGKERVTVTTIEQLTGITAQHNEIVKRVSNGTLDPAAVRRALQSIIEGKFVATSWAPPSWWRTPSQQLARASQLWPGRQLPEPPSLFTPRTMSEVPLLHVPDSFDNLWSKVIAPSGYGKIRRDDITDHNMRLTPNKVEYSQPVWLAFDPDSGRGVAPHSMLGWPELAASEIFSALIQFPEWPLTWFNGASAPNLLGYQLEFRGEWEYMPIIGRWNETNLFELGVNHVYFSNDDWSSPTVREY